MNTHTHSQQITIAFVFAITMVALSSILVHTSAQLPEELPISYEQRAQNDTPAQAHQSIVASTKLYLENDTMLHTNNLELEALHGSSRGKTSSLLGAILNELLRWIV